MIDVRNEEFQFVCMGKEACVNLTRWLQDYSNCTLPRTSGSLAGGQSHRQGRSPSHFLLRRPQASQLLRMPYSVGFTLPPVGIAEDTAAACPGCFAGAAASINNDHGFS